MALADPLLLISKTSPEKSVNRVFRKIKAPAGSWSRAGDRRGGLYRDRGPAPSPIDRLRIPCMMKSLARGVPVKWIAA